MFYLRLEGGRKWVSNGSVQHWQDVDDPLILGPVRCLRFAEDYLQVYDDADNSYVLSRIHPGLVRYAGIWWRRFDVGNLSNINAGNGPIERMTYGNLDVGSDVCPRITHKFQSDDAAALACLVRLGAAIKDQVSPDVLSQLDEYMKSFGRYTRPTREEIQGLFTKLEAARPLV